LRPRPQVAFQDYDVGMKRQARLPRPVAVVLLLMAVLVAAGAAPAQAGSIRHAAAGSHESQARADFRAPATALVVSRSHEDADPPFMCRDKGQAPADDWD
jgi:hypothetical protein